MVESLENVYVRDRSTIADKAGMSVRRKSTTLTQPANLIGTTFISLCAFTGCTDEKNIRNFGANQKSKPICFPRTRAFCAVKHLFCGTLCK